LQASFLLAAVKVECYVPHFRVALAFMVNDAARFGHDAYPVALVINDLVACCL
jgi:hypothetical protein